MKNILLISIVLIFQYCKAQPTLQLTANPDNNSLLWEVSGNKLKAPTYLFGTFHLMCKEDIVLSENLRKALTASKEVYFEMDLDDPSTMLGGLFFVNMKDGKTLRDLYSPEQYNRLESFFRDSLHMGLTMFSRMKPSLIESTLYPKMMPCKNMSGVEMEIMELAKKDKKEIKGFETIAFQTSVFDSIPYQDQAKELLTLIDSMKTYAGYFDTLLLTYKKQQIEGLEKMFDDPKYNTGEMNQDLLLYNRNKNWVTQLNKIMPDTNVFVAVGAGHLIGEKGLISLLRKEGYTVRPLLNK